MAMSRQYGMTIGAGLIEPHVGQFRSNQIGVGPGSLIVLAIALVFIRWIGASRSSQYWGSGFSAAC